MTLRLVPGFGLNCFRNDCDCWACPDCQEHFDGIPVFRGESCPWCQIYDEAAEENLQRATDRLDAANRALVASLEGR